MVYGLNFMAVHLNRVLGELDTLPPFLYYELLLLYMYQKLFMK